MNDSSPNANNIDQDGDDETNIATQPPTPYLGVTYEPCIGKWRARIYCQGMHTTLGRFSTAHEAARAHDRAACFLHRDAAVTNFGIDAARIDLQTCPPTRSQRAMSRLRRIADELQGTLNLNSSVRWLAAVQSGALTAAAETAAAQLGDTGGAQTRDRQGPPAQSRNTLALVALLCFTAVRVDATLPAAFQSRRAIATTSSG